MEGVRGAKRGLGRGCCAAGECWLLLICACEGRDGHDSGLQQSDAQREGGVGLPGIGSWSVVMQRQHDECLLCRGVQLPRGCKGGLMADKGERKFRTTALPALGE